jgi:peptidyl-prolyl cis-trans isomerase C
MAISVNGMVIPERVIQEEMDRMARDRQWLEVTDERERMTRLRRAAEYSAVNRTLLEQAVASDERPLDPALVEAEVNRLKAQNGCRAAFDDTALRAYVEHGLRLGRITKEFTAGAARPSLAEIQAFYDANRANFRSLARYQAAHIVKHVNQDQDEQSALEGIRLALAALGSGEDFAAVAERFSDCKDNGGDLGTFDAGVMVEEFEAAIRGLRPGQRTGIFKTPFGYHIAELRSSTPGGATASFEEVRPDIEKVLTAVMEQREFLKAIGRLRDQADIRLIDGEQLDRVPAE